MKALVALRERLEQEARCMSDTALEEGLTYEAVYGESQLWYDIMSAEQERRKASLSA